MLIVSIVSGIVVLGAVGIVALAILLPGALDRAADQSAAEQNAADQNAAEPAESPEATYVPAPQAPMAPYTAPPNEPNQATGPVAIDPTDCIGQCLTYYDAIELSPDYESLQLVGGMRSFEYWSASIAAGEEADAAAQRWAERHGTPASCSFIESTAPVWRESTGPDATTEMRDQDLSYLGAYGADDEYVEQYVRVFNTSAQAAEFIATLDAAIDACPRYSDDFTSDEKASGVINSLRPQSSSPAVAGTGWLEVFDWGGSFSAETLQYKNLVVTSTFYRENHPRVNSMQFDDFVTDTSARLEALAPSS